MLPIHHQYKTVYYISQQLCQTLGLSEKLFIDLYLFHWDVACQEKHIEVLSLCSKVYWFKEQQNLTRNWFLLVPKPRYVPDEAKGREVSNFHDHVSVCDLSRLEDLHFTSRDVDYRQTVGKQSCENTKPSDICLTPKISLQ